MGKIDLATELNGDAIRAQHAKNPGHKLIE